MALAAITRATTVLTFTQNAATTNTVVIGGKTYTFQTTLTNVDGNVLLGATTAESITNLVAAVNLGTGAGTLYATLMTLNQQVRARSSDATTITFEATSPGTVGNLIACTDTLAGSSAFTGALMTGGTGSMGVALTQLRRECQLNSHALQLLDYIDGGELAEV